MTLEQLMEFAAEQAAGLFSIQEQVWPLVHAIDAKGDHHILSVPGMGGTDQEKDDASEALREFFKANNIKRFAMIMEAWMLDLKELPPGGRVPRPSTSPDRIEVISITVADETGEMMGRIPIVRTNDAKPTTGKLETYRPTMAEGRFVGLLPAGNKQ